MGNGSLEGKVVLGYKVKEKLGSGTFGTVYRVVKSNPSGDYTRALKHITIPSDNQQYNSVFNSMGGDLSKVDDYFSEMLKNIVSEIQILNTLSEKGITGIVRYYENDIVTSEAPKRYDIYILMEYLTPLSDYLSQEDFTVRDTIKLGLDILSALILCHKNGVIHRDIKDDNIFVSLSGEYKIGDFGVSKILKDSTRAESVKGTPNFLAPEVYLGKEGYTQSVDLYSLGIVLYRLLNYSRNPFLPPFPENFNHIDEDKSFKERMTGKIPPLPILGGEAIGEVIIKAVSPKDERYKNAEEFKQVLEDAVNKTANEELDRVVNFRSASNTMSNERNATIKEEKVITLTETITEPLSMIQTALLSEETDRTALHSELFDTIGEHPNLQIPNEYGEPPLSHIETTPPPIDNTSSGFLPVTPSDTDTVTPIDSNIIGKLLYFVPVVLIIIGLVAYFVIIPNVYGNVVSFIDWLFTNPQNIIDTLRDSNQVLPKIHNIIGLRIFSWLWLAAFIFSLFMVGKQLQKKPEITAVNATLLKKDAFYIIQDIASGVKKIKTLRSGKELEALYRNIKKLEEKLSVESEFGYGRPAVIDCEANIATQLYYLQNSIKFVENGNFIENINNMNTAVTNISDLLKKRASLKTR